MALRRPIKLALASGILIAGALALRAWLTLPLGPDRPELAQFAPARSTPPVQVEVTPLRLGGTRAPRCAGAGSASCFRTEEVVHVAYLVRHPRVTFLIDASVRAHASEDLARFPALVRLALGFDQTRGLREALRSVGDPKLDFVLITHAHWDHTGGLLDLDHPKVIVGPGEERFIRDYPPGAMPIVIPEHLRDATVSTFAWDGPPVETFPFSHDLLGDGSVVLVPLPGHTPGSMGVLVSGVHGRRLLFIGDAAWDRDAVYAPSMKLRPVARLADDDWTRESETLWRLHHLHLRDPELMIVPAHDGEALAEVAALDHAPPNTPR